ncbi:MAG: hypothetical protein H6719_31580 [Sandaracinaceae bacterium]|nr:hypothetical protein [Sandaracinaceae bacterium]
MHASMRVTPWAELPYPSDVLTELVDPASRSGLEAARRALAPIPTGLGHHGVGGDALATELARMLACPAIAQATSATLVPFPLATPTAEGEHLVLEAARLTQRWPGTTDPAYATAVADARRAVRRGAPSAIEHQLWLEHFLVEQLLPAAARLALPVVVSWPARGAAQTPIADLATRLDEALDEWIS